ncbi:MAG: hypothetical protein U0531_11345 [Dehalococcoidia bacterium]
MTREFRNALVFTAIPITLLSVLSTGGRLVAVSVTTVWLVALAAWFAGVVALLVLAITGKTAAAGGVVAGLGIGFVALFTTCLVNLSTAY